MDAGCEPKPERLFIKTNILLGDATAPAADIISVIGITASIAGRKSGIAVRGGGRIFEIIMDTTCAGAFDISAFPSESETRTCEVVSLTKY